MIWALLVIYQIKHWVCDYPLQGKYMLGKFKPFPEFILPLTAHAAVHGVATFFIASMFNSKIALSLAFVDFIWHWFVDFLKANPDIGGRFKALTKSDFVEHQAKVQALRAKVQEYSLSQETLSLAADYHSQLQELHGEWFDKEKSNKFFWWALGADQMAHHLTHYAIIYCILN